jgi:hypothetical protein
MDTGRLVLPPDATDSAVGFVETVKSGGGVPIASVAACSVTLPVPEVFCV